MKIYLAHSSNMNYGKLYKAFSLIDEVKFVFPHISKEKNSKTVIKGCDLFIADVSKPSHGVGIEIGWANSFGIPIILICKKGSKISSSLKFVSKKIIIYKNFDDAKDKIKILLRRI